MVSPFVPWGVESSYFKSYSHGGGVRWLRKEDGFDIFQYCWGCSSGEIGKKKITKLNFFLANRNFISKPQKTAINIQSWDQATEADYYGLGLKIEPYIMGITKHLN